MKKVLLKDITIPAGTVFVDAPTVIKLSKGFGLADNSFGSFVYDMEGDHLKEWFRDID